MWQWKLVMSQGSRKESQNNETVDCFKISDCQDTERHIPLPYLHAAPNTRTRAAGRTMAISAAFATCVGWPPITSVSAAAAIDASGKATAQVFTNWHAHFTSKNSFLGEFFSPG